jgi:hypothetical protein
VSLYDQGLHFHRKKWLIILNLPHFGLHQFILVIDLSQNEKYYFHPIKLSVTILDDLNEQLNSFTN